MAQAIIHYPVYFIIGITVVGLALVALADYLTFCWNRKNKISSQPDMKKEANIK